ERLHTQVVQRLGLEPPTLRLLPLLSPAQLVPRTLAKQNRKTAIQLHNRISTSRNSRSRRIMPFRAHRVTVIPRPGTEPLIQRTNPRPCITKRALLTLGKLHVRGLSRTDRISRCRVS